MEPAPDPPLDALPRALADMVQAVVEARDCDSAMALAAALGAASIAGGDRAELLIKDDHRECANLYFLVGAQPGAGKTPVLAPFAEPLHEWQRESRPDWQRRAAQWEAAEASRLATEKAIAKKLGDLELSEADRQKLIGAMAEAKAAATPRPGEPVIATSNATSEKLGAILEANGGAAGIWSSEARDMLAVVAGKYSSTGREDSQCLLAGWGRDFLRIDRLSRPAVMVNAPCLSVCMATQFDALRTLATPQAHDSGLLPRFNFILPEKAPTTYPDATVSEAAASAWRSALRRLLGLVNRDAPAREYRFDDAGGQRWRTFFSEAKLLAGDTISDHDPPLVRSWWSKAPTHCARLALLLHLLDDPDADTIPECEVMTAEALVSDWLYAHQRRAAAIVGEDAEAAVAARLWNWIVGHVKQLRAARADEGHEGVLAVKPRDIVRAGAAGLNTVDAALPVIARLVGLGHLRELDLFGDGSRPHKVFMVHPAAEGGIVC